MKTNSTLKFFKGCTTLDEVKALYKNLAKENHPDRGGDVEVMKAINNEYEVACKLIAAGAKMTSEEFENEILNAEAYKNAINAIISIQGIIIECVGSWVWVTGDTYPYRKELKEAAFMFASKKKAWYFRTDENKVRSKDRVSLDQIRAKYGSTVVAGGYQKNLLK